MDLRNIEPRNMRFQRCQRNYRDPRIFSRPLQSRYERSRNWSRIVTNCLDSSQHYIVWPNVQQKRVDLDILASLTSFAATCKIGTDIRLLAHLKGSGREPFEVLGGSKCDSAKAMRSERLCSLQTFGDFGGNTHAYCCSMAGENSG
jgi:hypothetical protein